MDLYGHPFPGANRSGVDRLAAATNCYLYATGEEGPEEKREVSSDEDWSRRRDLNPRPADYETRAGGEPALPPRRDLTRNLAGCLRAFES